MKIRISELPSVGTTIDPAAFMAVVEGGVTKRSAISTFIQPIVDIVSLLSGTSAGVGIIVSGSLISADPNVVAMRSGSSFQSLSASIQRLPSGLSYLVGAGSISITSQSNGQIIISGSATGGGTVTAGTGINVVGSQVSINDNIVATLSGSTFTGIVNAGNGLSGSLQRTTSGLSYLVGTGGTAVISQSNGQIFISSSAPQNPTAGIGITVAGTQVSVDPNIVAMRSGSSFQSLSASIQRLPSGLSYIVAAGAITVTSQSNGQIIISGSGDTTAVGTGLIKTGNTLSINDNVVATVSGTRFTGPVSASAGFTGSLQLVSPGIPFLLSQGNITLTTQSNGQIIISGSGDTTAAGNGLIKTNNALSINDNIVATVSGTRFTGPVSASAGFTGSLSIISPGIPYLLSQGGITLTTMSNGQIIISASSGDSSLAGVGLIKTSNVLSINDNVVATVSGTRFTGPVSASAGFTGSLQLVSPGIPFLLSQGGITLTTMSNGQIIISGAVGGGAAAPEAGTGILVNGSTISINDNVVATLTGSTFTGVVNAGGGLSGSLQRTTSGLSYLVGAGGTTVTSQSNGQILVSSSVPQAGTGITLAGSTINVNPNVVAMRSGSSFQSLSASIQRLPSGLSYLVGVGGVSVTSQSNGQILVSGSAGGFPTAGTGIFVAGTQVSINNNVVATVSGSTFTGAVTMSGSLIVVPGITNFGAYAGGSSPASTGIIRLPNATNIRFRNAAGNGDVDGLAVDSSNNVILGNSSDTAITVNDATDTVNIRTSGSVQVAIDANSVDIQDNYLVTTAHLRVGTTPAASGQIRIPNSTALTARNNANNGDKNLVSTNSADEVILGTSSDTSVVTNDTTDTVVLRAGNTAMLTVVSGSGVTIGDSNVIIEGANLSGRKIVSLARGSAISATQMPAGTGDGVVFLANASITPSANPTTGSIAYSVVDEVTGDTGFCIRSTDGVMRIGARAISNLEIRAHEYPGSGLVRLVAGTIYIGNADTLRVTSNRTDLFGSTWSSTSDGNIVLFNSTDDPLTNCNGLIYIGNTRNVSTTPPVAGGRLFSSQYLVGAVGQLMWQSASGSQWSAAPNTEWNRTYFTPLTGSTSSTSPTVISTQDFSSLPTCAGTAKVRVFAIDSSPVGASIIEVHFRKVVSTLTLLTSGTTGGAGGIGTLSAAVSGGSLQISIAASSATARSYKTLMEITYIQ